MTGSGLPEKAAIIQKPGVSGHRHGRAAGQEGKFLSDNPGQIYVFKARQNENWSIHFAQLAAQTLYIRAVTTRVGEPTGYRNTPKGKR